MPADGFMLIPAGMTLIKMGKQAKWPSVALQLCDCTPSSFEIFHTLKFFSHSAPCFLEGWLFQGS